MDIWRRIHNRRCSSARILRRGPGRERNPVCFLQLPARYFRIFFSSSTPRGITAQQFRQLWPDGSDRGIGLGEKKYPRFRRRPGPYHHRRSVCRIGECELSSGFSPCKRSVPGRDRGKRITCSGKSFTPHAFLQKKRNWRENGLQKNYTLPPFRNCVRYPLKICRKMDSEFILQSSMDM